MTWEIVNVPSYQCNIDQQYRVAQEHPTHKWLIQDYTSAPLQFQSLWEISWWQATISSSNFSNPPKLPSPKTTSVCFLDSRAPHSKSRVSQLHQNRHRDRSKETQQRFTNKEKQNRQEGSSISHRDTSEKTKCSLWGSSPPAQTPLGFLPGCLKCSFYWWE